MRKLPEEIKPGQDGWLRDTEQAYRSINWLMETVTALVYCFVILALALLVVGIVAAH